MTTVTEEIEPVVSTEVSLSLVHYIHLSDLCGTLSTKRRYTKGRHARLNGSVKCLFLNTDRICKRAKFQGKKVERNRMVAMISAKTLMDISIYRERI